jgi:hypothetical protein
MKRLLLTLVLLWLVGAVSAEEHPTHGIIYHTKEMSLITYRCDSDIVSGYGKCV